MSDTVRTVLAGAAIAAAFALTGGAFAGLTGAALWKSAAYAFGSTLILGGLSAALQRDPSMRGAGMRGRTQSVRQSAEPWHVVFGRVRKGGVFTFIHTTGSNNKFLHLVIVLAAHEVESIGRVYFDNEEAFDADGQVTNKFSGRAQLEKRLGADDQSAISIPEAGDLWGDDHRLRGHAHIYLRLQFDHDVYPNGIPNISVDLEGYNGIFDPRTGTTGYSRNDALCLAAYKENERWGKGVDRVDIDEDWLIEAANVCDEEVQLDGGGTELRYQCDGVFHVDERPLDIIEELLSAMAGEDIYSGGMWRIQAGAYREPEVTITPDDFRGGISLQTRVSRRENFNAVNGTFISPEHDWEESDFPQYASEFYAEEDDRKITKDIVLPFTISPSACQRIAKIELERARRQQTLDAPLGLSGILAQAGSTVMVDYPRWGFDEKPFEVRELGFAEDNDGMGVDLVLRETSPLVFDWSATEEQIMAAAPLTNLPSAFDVPTPNTPTVTEALYVTSNSAGVKVLVELDWTGSELDFVDRFQVQFRRLPSAEWQAVPSTEMTRIEIRDIEPGDYVFRVRAMNRLGVTSPWAPTTPQEIQGTTGPPEQLQGLVILAVGGMAILRWDEHPALDVRIGGSIQFRHSRQQVGATWASSVSIGDKMPGSDTVAILPLKPGTYLAKPRNAGGLLADDPAIVVSHAGEVLTFANIDTIQEHPSWAGTMTNVEEDAGNLVLVEGETQGTYRFSAGFDFVNARKFRLRTEIDFSIINVGLNIDDREDNIDDWPDFDGTIDADADAQVYVRTTNDDPAGSPEWSEWNRIDSGEFEVRAAEFELRMRTADPAFIPMVSDLWVRADEVTNGS